MSVYIVSEKPVYLSSRRNSDLRALLLRDKGPSYRISSRIANTKANAEVREIIGKFLLAEHDKDPKKFYSQWVHFDISGDEACAEVSWLLHCYCLYHGYAKISDLRDTIQIITSDWEGAKLQQPFGSVFMLEHLVKPAMWWWKYTRKMHGCSIRIVIAPKLVYRLAGELGDFTLYSESFDIRCAEDVTVFPRYKHTNSPAQIHPA